MTNKHNQHNQKKLLVSLWIAPDGTKLHSKSQHDFVSYTDADGNYYAVDGGTLYTRIVGDLTSACLYEGDNHEEIRKYFSWKTYDKNGDEPGKWVTLDSMTNQHIEAILRTQWHIVGTAVERLFQAELEYRKVNNILIED